MATLTYNPNDPQQFALYDAEAALNESKSIVHFRDKNGALSFIRMVASSKEWMALGGPAFDDIAVVWTRHDSGIASCNRSKRQIGLPGWAYNTHTILHEMAHLVKRDSHGPMFAGTALMLYRRFIAESFADDIEKHYRIGSVQFKRRRFAYKSSQISA